MRERVSGSTSAFGAHMRTMAYRADHKNTHTRTHHTAMRTQLIIIVVVVRLSSFGCKRHAYMKMAKYKDWIIAPLNAMHTLIYLFHSIHSLIPFTHKWADTSAAKEYHLISRYTARPTHLFDLTWWQSLFLCMQKLFGKFARFQFFSLAQRLIPIHSGSVAVMFPCRNLFQHIFEWFAHLQ